MAIKTQGSYHGFKVQAELDDEGGVKIISVADSEGVARTKLAGKSFPNARQAGRAAFDAITDYEKLPRLPDARFMTLKATDGKTVSARTAKPAKTTAKAKTSKAAPEAEVTASNGVRKSNPAANKSKNAKASASRKPSAVTSKTKPADKASPKSAKSSKKQAAATVSDGAEDLDI